MDFVGELLNVAEKYGIFLSKEQGELFLKYKDLILEWNQKFNLTAIKDESDIIIKHFLDSLVIGKYINSGNLIDIGTGAGFPGIPLKILFPHMEMTLVDSTNKKILFLKEVKKELCLENISFIHKRAEEMGVDSLYREKFSFVVSRAVSNLQVLSELCIPLLKVNGSFIAMKGPGAEEEIKLSKSGIKILGGEISKVDEIELPKDNLRKIILITKKQKTPKQYPRVMSKISKMPL